MEEPGNGRTAAALILAAGLSTRFGGRKLLAPIDGQPMLQRVLDLAAAAELAPVVVVMGASADEIEQACTWRNELRVRNPTPEDGLATSVRIGIRTLSRLRAARTVVLMGDQPFLRAEQLRLILDARGQIVVPRFDGNPGSPVVLDRSVWPVVQSLQGDRGFSQLFGQYPSLVTYVDVPGSNPDVDTRGDVAANLSAQLD